MNGESFPIWVDGHKVAARSGQTILQACDEAGVYIPRLCYHPDLPPAGHCRVCTCKINGRNGSACNTPAAPGMEIENDNPQLNEDRKTLIELLFIEGNHFCQACEKSGSCELQAMAYRLGIDGPRLPYLWKPKSIDATHPEIYLDRNRCILCGRCARASKTEDEKSVFGFAGRGIQMEIAVDSSQGLKETQLDTTDKAASVCPVGCIVRKEVGFRVPYGQREFDQSPIGSDIEAGLASPGD